MSAKSAVLEMSNNLRFAEFLPRHIQWGWWGHKVLPLSIRQVTFRYDYTEVGR